MAAAPEEQLLQAWEANAAAWTAAVRERAIPTRIAGTDQAIVEAVQALRPARVLDVGCGEGWLARRVRRETGCEVTGIDGSAPLIAAARAADPHGSYRVLSYREAIAQPSALGGPHDLAVCNFALFGESLAPLLGAVASALAPRGALLIQTLHPWAVCGEQPYRDGWREETFAGFGGDRWQPMPWYFRTLESWYAEIRAAGLALAACREPRDPATLRPLSLLLQLARS